VIFMFIESSFVNVCTSSNKYGKDVAISASKGVLIRIPTVASEMKKTSLIW